MIVLSICKIIKICFYLNFYPWQRLIASQWDAINGVLLNKTHLLVPDILMRLQNLHEVIDAIIGMFIFYIGQFQIDQRIKLTSHFMFLCDLYLNEWSSPFIANFSSLKLTQFIMMEHETKHRHSGKIVPFLSI